MIPLFLISGYVGSHYAHIGVVHQKNIVENISFNSLMPGMMIQNSDNSSQILDLAFNSSAHDWNSLAVKINNQFFDDLTRSVMLSLGKSWSSLPPDEVEKRLRSIESNLYRNIFWEGYINGLAFENQKENFKKLTNSSLSDPLKTILPREFIDKWIVKDPAAAAHAAVDTKNYIQAAESLMAWLGKDRVLASEWIQNLSREQRDITLLAAMEKSNLKPKDTMNLLNQIGKQPGKSLTTEIINSLPLATKEDTMKWLNTIEDPFVKSSGINRLIEKQAAKSKPEEVYQFVDQAPSATVQKRIIESWVHAQETWNLQGILAATSQWASPKVRKQAAERIIGRWHYQEPSKCSAWIKQSGDPVAMEALQGAIASAQARAAQKAK